MDGSRFRMDRVLRVRRIEAELARSRWWVALRDSARAEERVGRARRSVLDSLARLAGLESSPSLDIASILASQADGTRLERELELLLEDARQKAEHAEAQREPWLRKDGEAEGLERLRKRRDESFRRELERRELELLDEVATRRHTRIDS